MDSSGYTVVRDALMAGTVQRAVVPGWISLSHQTTTSALSTIACSPICGWKTSPDVSISIKAAGQFVLETVDLVTGTFVPPPLSCRPAW